jgi:MFS transporter, MCT family, solute carrier family 16 (monocarboxylic acid transporters), member 10
VIAFLGLYTILTYIATDAIQLGTSESTGYNLVTISNAPSVIGYFLTGLLADKLGLLNVMTPLTPLAGM